MALDKTCWIADYQKPEDLIEENGLLKQLAKALVERAMNAELTHHIGYKKTILKAAAAVTPETGRAATE